MVKQVSLALREHDSKLAPTLWLCHNVITSNVAVSTNGTAGTHNTTAATNGQYQNIYLSVESLKQLFTTCSSLRCIGIVGEPMSLTIAGSKPIGSCPPVKGFGACAELCHNCVARGLLCCSNGCGHQCMKPVYSGECNLQRKELPSKRNQLE